jgi:uncharacterized membrane protein
MILSQVPGWTHQLHQVIAEDIGRIAWNIALALIPLTLSFFLFNQPRSRWFSWSTYVILGFSSIVGIKKYSNGDILQSLKGIIRSLWGVRAIFLVIAIGLIIILMIIDIRAKAQQQNNRSLSWWLGLLIFIGFLPNAPYILTDIVHFYDAVRSIQSVWGITLVIVPIYILFIGIGWFAYVFSLLNVRKYLAKNQLDRYISTAELSLHLLCAIGIYIGRFIRFNSWSLITAPREFIRVLPEELIGKFPIVVILITFLIIMVLYSISKFTIERPTVN